MASARIASPGNSVCSGMKGSASRTSAVAPPHTPSCLDAAANIVTGPEKAATSETLRCDSG